MPLSLQLLKSQFQITLFLLKTYSLLFTTMIKLQQYPILRSTLIIVFHCISQGSPEKWRGEERVAVRIHMILKNDPESSRWFGKLHS